MAAVEKRTSRNWLTTVLSLILLGFLLLPALAFFTGKALAGPYEGPYGVLGFLIDIYGDVLRGNWAAATLVAMPTIIFLIWLAAIRLRRILVGTTTHSGA